VLLQAHVATEETKFGLDASELDQIIQSATVFKNVSINGLMGMASFTEDNAQVKREFQQLKQLFDKFKPHIPTFTILSMGMSGDFNIAIGEGSNMVRIGSLLFGERNSKG
jgi:uncharacterized pyridoxal phosphate-containing UPF0001 family protein